MKKIDLLILFGGENSEYEISLKSTVSILKNINKEKYNIKLIGITKNGQWLSLKNDKYSIDEIKDDMWYKNINCVTSFISPSKNCKSMIKLIENNYIFENVDVVLPILHGKNAEDGTIQGLLDLSGIPYVGCKTTSSAICMDKVITNTILEKNNINHTKWEYISKFDTKEEYKQKLSKINSTFNYPLFVKPSKAGSSVGVSKVSENFYLEEAINKAFEHDDFVLIEEGIIGRELEVAIFGIKEIKASCVGEIICDDFYSYDSKYISNTSRVSIPAEIDDDISLEIRNIALKTYRILGCSTLSRVDFFLEKETNKIFVNEVNTMPGFTDISMYPKLFMEENITYSELIDMIISVNI